MKSAFAWLIIIIFSVGLINTESLVLYYESCTILTNTDVNTTANYSNVLPHWRTVSSF